MRCYFEMNIILKVIEKKAKIIIEVTSNKVVGHLATRSRAWWRKNGFASFWVSLKNITRTENTSKPTKSVFREFRKTFSGLLSTSISNCFFCAIFPSIMATAHGLDMIINWRSIVYNIERSKIRRGTTCLIETCRKNLAVNTWRRL